MHEGCESRYYFFSSVCVWWYHFFSSVVSGDTACWLWRVHVCIAFVRSVCVILFTHWEKMITSHNTLRREKIVSALFTISSPVCDDIISSLFLLRSVCVVMSNSSLFLLHSVCVVISNSSLFLLHSVCAMKSFLLYFFSSVCMWWYHFFSSVSGTLVHNNARSSSFAESSPAHAPPPPPARVFDLRVFVRGLESLRVCVRVCMCRIRVYACAWWMFLCVSAPMRALWMHLWHVDVCVSIYI